MHFALAYLTTVADVRSHYKGKKLFRYNIAIICHGLDPVYKVLWWFKCVSARTDCPRLSINFAIMVQRIFNAVPMSIKSLVYAKDFFKGC